MISKKICMIGAFAVGKTSLVKQFVESIFGNKYHTTIGVKIDKKIVSIEQTELELMIWDVEGVDIFTELKPSYLRGASGVILVIDGTRPNTLDVAAELQTIVKNIIPEAHIILLLNKFDLSSAWAISEDKLQDFQINAENVFKTSAKSNLNVEEAFSHLGSLLIKN